jgi:hypothetical protein
VKHALVGLFLLGCDTDPVHTFVGRRFVPSGDCLDPPSVLDIVVGDAATCPVKCLAFKGEGGTTTVYTTVECPPYPVGFDPTELDPQCTPAKAAFDAKRTCAKDAGSE